MTTWTCGFCQKPTTSVVGQCNMAWCPACHEKCGGRDGVIALSRSQTVVEGANAKWGELYRAAAAELGITPEG